MFGAKFWPKTSSNTGASTSLSRSKGFLLLMGFKSSSKREMKASSPKNSADFSSDVR